MKDISNLELTLLPKLRNTVIIKFTVEYCIDIITEGFADNEEVYIYDKKEISLDPSKFAELIDPTKLVSFMQYLGAYSKLNTPTEYNTYCEYSEISSIDSITYYDDFSNAYKVKILS